MHHIHTLPAFTDNYFWLIQPDDQVKDVFIVDPGDAQVVMRALKTKELNLKAILLTHHHHDHIDGANELGERFNIPIYGPKSEKIPKVTHALFEGDQLNLSDKISSKILSVSGHTKDHIAYYIDTSTPLLFSGDTIFSAGCGRIFDGDADTFFQTINRIKQLPPNTLIYAAHEYTLANLRFAQYIEPENPKIQTRKIEVEHLRKQNLPSLPTQLEQELQFNPFLRTQIKVIQERTSELAGIHCDTQAQVFRELRRLKDAFQ